MTKITVSDDISFNVFSLVLEFLYTGKIQLGKVPYYGGRWVKWEEWRRSGQRRADLSSVTDVEDDDDGQVTKITVSDDISFNVFSLVLEFLYTGEIQTGNRTEGGG